MGPSFLREISYPNLIFELQIKLVFAYFAHFVIPSSQVL